MRHCEVTDRMLRDEDTWSGETLCVKKYPTNGEKAGIMGYSKFGVLTTTQRPLIIYLRENFTQTMQYDTVEACMADGWVVD